MELPTWPGVPAPAYSTLGRRIKLRKDHAAAIGPPPADPRLPVTPVNFCRAAAVIGAKGWCALIYERFVQMRHSRPQICSALIVGAIALGCLIAAAKAPVRATETAAAEADAAPCVAPADLALPLKRTSHQLAARKLTVIVALGSSSTAGVGASSPEAAYPSRLMVELGQRFPTEPLMVLNRGVAGARAVDMVASLDEAVATDHPDLVLWQLGTNAVLRGYEHARSDIVVRQGIKKIKAIGADTVLIDPQYAPKVIEHRQIEDMIGLISNAAAAEKVGVFHRFALMRYWHEHAGMPFEAFLSPDGLHMNDWAHSCLARALADAIADAAAPDHTRGNESSQLDNAAGDSTVGERR
jgi:acyl-CoA thioesterase-1